MEVGWQGDATRVIQEFRYDLSHQYRVVEITAVVITQAMALAQMHALRGYDAVQLAAALVVHHMRSTLELSPWCSFQQIATSTPRPLPKACLLPIPLRRLNRSKRHGNTAIRPTNRNPRPQTAWPGRFVAQIVEWPKQGFGHVCLMRYRDMLCQHARPLDGHHHEAGVSFRSRIAKQA